MSKRKHQKWIYQVDVNYDSYDLKHSLINRLAGKTCDFYTCNSLSWYYYKKAYADKLAKRLRKIKHNRKWIKSVKIHSLFQGF